MLRGRLSSAMRTNSSSAGAGFTRRWIDHEPRDWNQPCHYDSTRTHRLSVLRNMVATSQPLGRGLPDSMYLGERVGMPSMQSVAAAMTLDSRGTMLEWNRFRCIRPRAWHEGTASWISTHQAGARHGLDARPGLQSIQGHADAWMGFAVTVPGAVSGLDMHLLIVSARCPLTTPGGTCDARHAQGLGSR